MTTKAATTRLRRHAEWKWTAGENATLFRRSGLTPRQAIDRSMAAVLRMRKHFSLQSIYLLGLDNPYMQEHARRTVASLMLRERQNHPRNHSKALRTPASTKMEAA